MTDIIHRSQGRGLRGGRRFSFAISSAALAAFTPELSAAATGETGAIRLVVSFKPCSPVCLACRAPLLATPSLSLPEADASLLLERTMVAATRFRGSGGAGAEKINDIMLVACSQHKICISIHFLFPYFFSKFPPFSSQLA
mmetsp:Transcript_36815/g.82992  ORF Transcript_36815/g.82992 Transcript_36815/m.82992 type:complete len:141 (-) Transcript_36815:682-1104(-)